VRTGLAALAALAAVSVALDVPPVGPTFLPPVRQAPARCEVPRTLAEAHDALGRVLALELVRTLAAKSEAEVIADDVHLGLWVREFWGLWNGGALHDHLAGLGLRHPDEMSELVLVTWWRHLHDQPLRVDDEVARLQGLRRGGVWRPDPLCVCHSYGRCHHQQYIRSFGGTLRGFALDDCCCGFRPRVTEGVVHTKGLAEPVVFPFFAAWRGEENTLCREVPFAAP
jgi:hypothetical protein